jgi:hypothetical protein
MALTAIDGAMATQWRQKVRWQRDGNNGNSNGRHDGNGRCDGDSNGNGRDGRQ